jgi:hypothetical protein
MDPEKMQKKFQEFVQEFMKNYSWSSVLNQTNRKKFHTELDEFVKKFNEEHAEKFGFKIEREAVEKSRKAFLIKRQIFFYLSRSNESSLLVHSSCNYVRYFMDNSAENYSFA